MNNKIVNFLREAGLIRQAGQTTWLLKAALNNPNCILVFGNNSIAITAKRRYEELKLESWDNLPFYKKWFLNKTKWMSRKNPIFLSVNQDSLRGRSLPIIFDSSCFNMFL